jgi:hypothetical protein
MTGVVRTTTLIALNCAALLLLGRAFRRSVSACDKNERKKSRSEYRRVLCHLTSKRQKRLLPRDTCTHYRWRRRLDLLSKLTG